MNDRAGGPAEGGREEKQDPNSFVNTIQSDGGSRPRDWTERPTGSTHSSTRCVRHPEQFERQAEFPSSRSEEHTSELQSP